jgi:nitrite reductase/ring-hydroxylating ferredoxin subunit
MMERFVPVAPAHALAEGALLGVALGDDRICLMRVQGAVFALEDVCPHQGYPMSTGELVEGNRLECPWHGAQFDCHSGAVLQGPATDPLATWDVREVDGMIEIGARRATE